MKIFVLYHFWVAFFYLLPVCLFTSNIFLYMTLIIQTWIRVSAMHKPTYHFFGFCLLFLHMYVYAHPKYRHVLLCFFSYPPHYLYHGNQCWRPNSSTQVCLCSDDLFITSRYTHVLRDTHTFILLNIRLFCLTARPFSSPH